MINLIRFKDATPFQKEVAQLFLSDLYVLNPFYPADLRRIVFVENQTQCTDVSSLGGRLNPSLERHLFNSALLKLKPLLSGHQLSIDVAGGGYDKLFDNKPHILNLAPPATFIEDAEGECKSVPKETYETALCLGYLLLAKRPDKVINNIASFLIKDGICILDFISLKYWYLGQDGRHWQAYNPSSIYALLEPYFEDMVFIPVGNWFQGACNYYAKYYEGSRKAKALKFIGRHFGGFDSSPMSAIQYLVVGRKKC